MNQKREVVDELVDAGRRYGFGLEAGTKAELLAALSADLDPERSSSATATRTTPSSAWRCAPCAWGRGLPDRREVPGDRAHPQRREGARRAPADRHARAAPRARLGQVGEVGRRGGEVRPDDAGDARRRRGPEAEEDARLPRHAPLPHRLPDHRDQDQERGQGGRARLREAARRGVPLEFLDVGGGLGVDYDGTQDVVRLLHELHAPGVRERRRLHGPADLRRRGRAGADARVRVGPRRRGLPLASS